jgi:hypothetical protein
MLFAGGFARSVAAGLLAACLGSGPWSAPAAADWLSRLIVAGEKAGSRAARHGLSSLDNAAAHVKRLAPGIKGPALAAHVGQEGHWTFVNAAGERFTAGTADELKRSVSVLAPSPAPADAKLTLLLTEDTVFKSPASLKDLPKDADLRLVIGPETYPLLRRSEVGAEKLLAEVRPNVLVAIADQKLFDEAAWQLGRSLNRANIRIVGLQPDGPQALSRTPAIDPSTKRALVDTVDPYKLAASLGSVRGQTIVLTGRIEGRFLYFKGNSGPERSTLVGDLTAAAEAADVNLVLLHAQTSRQPGGRNWLWQRIVVKGLDEAMQRATMADFFAAVAGRHGQLVMTATEQGKSRVSLRAELVRSKSVLPSAGEIGDVFSDLLADVTGKVVTAAIDADLKNAERQRELDNRLIPGVPTAVQGVYLAAFVAGLVGIGFARRWWARVWPPEQRDAYAGAFGYWAARAVRLLAFTALFMPLVSIVSAPLSVLKGAWDMLASMGAILAWPFRRRTASPS